MSTTRPVYDVDSQAYVAPTRTVQTTAPILASAEAEADIAYVLAQPFGEGPEISDATARTIASWWHSPGAVGRVLATLSSGLPTDLTALLDDIHATRVEAGYGTHPDLDCLATWAINTATR